MVLEPIQCPACQCTNVVKHGKSTEGKQRYKCRNTDCSRSTNIGAILLPGLLKRALNNKG